MFATLACWLLFTASAKQAAAQPAGGQSLTGGIAHPSYVPRSNKTSPPIDSHGGISGPELLTRKLAFNLNYVAIALILSTFLYRIIVSGVRYVRTLACLGSDRQLLFLRPNQVFAFVKKHVMDAPLFHKRHIGELKLSSAVSGGDLPTRLEFILIAGTLVTNIALSVVYIHWSEGEEVVLAELRNRTGMLALANMLPIFILSARNNPLIMLLNIPFEAFNMIHRWLGRIVVLEVMCHTICHLISMVKFSGGWARVGLSIQNNRMILGGFLGATAAIFLLMHSPSPIRHAFYETFLHLHIALVILFVVGVWIHIKGYPFLLLLKLPIIAWALDVNDPSLTTAKERGALIANEVHLFPQRAFRLASILYRNVGKRGTRASIETLPGDAIRVTLSITRPWTFRPGQHIYLYIPSIGLWTSHPFAVCWSEEEDRIDPEKGIALSKQDFLASRKTAMSLIVRRRTGFTDKLFKKAKEVPEGRATLSAFVEGPYGGHHNLGSYGTVMLFASGIGITHQVPYVRSLVTGYANNTVACRKLTLVWIIQSPEHLEWIRPWMTSILSLPSRREVLKIMLFVTRPRSTREIHSPSSTVQMFPGKPNVETLIELETTTQIGAMAVSACGAGPLADDVRSAVRKRQGERSLELVEVAFSW
ncbi:MAG: hypothetical protein M1840_003583 [Geoglossum simile]|nr:MAG: hypothetical protein M1840_003583 [Geoglossum simile]